MYRLTSLEVEKLNEELASLDATIKDLEDILAKPERIRAIIKDDLISIKDKYSCPRQTEISYDPSSIDAADLIAKEDVVISMTHLGYVKRLPISEYRAQRRGGRGITAPCSLRLSPFWRLRPLRLCCGTAASSPPNRRP